ncbi:MAG: flavin reductase family protein [Gemmobacter sp.]|nr:flavin reductase family protein [Gemmobacter sp.]
MTADTPLDPQNSTDFRTVMAQYPTGVCAITSLSQDGAPLAMVVGTFSSVSLDPPLVGFFPAKTSSTWPLLAATGGFCVNVLALDQQALCRKLATKGEDRFAGVSWRPAPSGAPILEGVVAWIDCSIEQITEAGDHDLVLGRVCAMGVDTDHPPLLFLRGGYGQMT